MEQQMALPGSGNTTGAPTVNSRTASSERMVRKASVCRALWGGTDAMRKAGTKHLPRETKESPAAYNRRLSTSVLYNAYKRAVLDLRGRPFRDGVQLTEGVPEDLNHWVQNIDLTGRSLSVFTRDVFTEALIPGLCHVLIEFPRFPVDKDGNIVRRSLGEEQEQGVRPWLVQVPMESVLGWRSEVIGGVRILTQVRIREVVTERDPENKWGEKQVTQVRVLEPGRFFVYRGSGKEEDNWRVPRLVDAGLTSFDEIPMYTVYANQTGFMTADPPLLDMAQNNVLHWQMSSDINHIVHVSNFPLLYLAGDLRGQGDEDDDPLADDSEEAEAGPNILIQGKVGTSLMFVEHTGKAIEAGEKRISKVEDHMAKMGLDLLIPRHGGPETATGREIDFSQSVSDLEAMTAATASTFDEILRDMVEASSSNESLPEGEGIVILGKNLGLSIKDANDLEALKFARENRDISRLQYLKELKRRRVLEAEYDPEEDEAQLDEEALGDDEGVDDTAFANAEIRSIGAV